MAIGLVFDFLAIVNAAALDIYIYVSRKQMCKSWLGVYLGGDVFGHRVYMYLISVDIAKRFSKGLVPRYTHWQRVWALIAMYPRSLTIV